MASGADANHERDMGLVIDRIEQLKRATLDGSVLVVAHTDKGDNGTRGSSAIEDDADLVWAAKADDYRIELACSKMKDGSDSERIDLKRVPVAGSLVLEPFLVTDTSETSEAQYTLIETLATFGLDGATSTELHAASGLPRTTYYRALNPLRQSGAVLNTGSRGRPLLVLASMSQSDTFPESPSEDPSSDLEVSQESREFQRLGREFQGVPPTSTGGTGTRECQDCGTPATGPRCPDCLKLFTDHTKAELVAEVGQ
jgi:hypothetical protein